MEGTEEGVLRDVGGLVVPGYAGGRAQHGTLVAADQALEGSQVTRQGAFDQGPVRIGPGPPLNRTPFEVVEPCGCCGRRHDDSRVVAGTAPVSLDPVRGHSEHSRPGPARNFSRPRPVGYERRDQTGRIREATSEERG